VELERVLTLTILTLTINIQICWPCSFIVCPAALDSFSRTRPLCGRLLPEARIAYLLARLNTPTHWLKDASDTLILQSSRARRSSQSLSAEAMINPKATKFSKATCNEFISYTLFGTTSCFRLRLSRYRAAAVDQIMLPRHVNDASRPCHRTLAVSSAATAEPVV
jgi:hypothetical protein